MNLYKNIGEEEYIKIQEGRSSYDGPRDLSPWAEYFLEYYPGYLQEPILDIGCGIGALMQSVRDKGKFVMGLDISRESSQRAIEDGYPVVNIDAQKRLPFPDKAFKTVLMFHTLEHTIYPKKVLKNIHRILDGSLCVISPLVSKREEGFGHFAYLPTVEYLESLFKDYKIIVSKEIGSGQLIIAKPIHEHP